mmetsp:Transcript_23270/g.45169  ORF Transcript_23270/g.45169 Transcript_23270/m.45169 type:complete len:559 (+) Transcript_23270:48-1724(+)|eukprot:CAMPEP_0173381044 /NCGR_PEP_ID=MMETSP1356-20130122/3547_1 /TAXON_ID=77927 ORGANISM="Hemiselmis virescens, Strain PCC157" /NCGR_SAMPLE_ID=MMETSP1356 /ASSEMBLY_ACC=CAM_ASM_000847 /LENGTH=558 /DNA_ID=CAMNT_0014334781 /DNA_START=37 /DNA_END=1713 /DNA_ORIENTATION=+
MARLAAGEALALLLLVAGACPSSGSPHMHGTSRSLLDSPAQATHAPQGIKHLAGLPSWANISKHFVDMESMFGLGKKKHPIYMQTHPTPLDTVVQAHNPTCYGKEASLLGSFCVAPTTEEEDKDPEHKLPRITFSVKSPGPLTIFLFDDEENSWHKFWGKRMQNRTCDEIKSHAKATITNAGDGLPAYKNIMGKVPHLWYVVAVDCQTRQCPHIDSANLTFFHPNSDGSGEFCTGLPEAALALKNSLLEGLRALSVESILNVAGLTHFGVFVLYMEFAVMFLFSVLFLIWGVRAESAKRFLYFNTFFCTAISCMAYLAMATGNGILVLRRLNSEGKGASWHLATPSVDMQHAALSEEYAAMQTYPVFFSRYLLQLFTSPLLLLDLFLITGVGFSTRAFMLFSNTMMVLCWMSGAFITKASRWGFWVFGLLFSLGVLIPLVGVLPTAAARKGRAARRLYGRLMCVTLVVGVLYPWAWVLVDGSHALPGDLAALLYALLDFMSQCVFGVVLLRRVPAMAEWGDELQGSDAKTQGAIMTATNSLSQEELEMGPEDDGEDNL